MASPHIAFQDLDASDRRFAWELNQSEVPHVGSETSEEFERLCAISVFAKLATVAGQPAGFLLGMTREADYVSPNFLWFRDRYEAFLYVDRIAVAKAFRKNGVGAALYREAERHAQEHALTVLCCEVNIRPPNPGSLSFHGKVGFKQVGTFDDPRNGKTVAMLVKTLS